MCASFSNPVKSTKGWIPTTATVKDVQIDTDPMFMTTTYKVFAFLTSLINVSKKALITFGSLL